MRPEPTYCRLGWILKLYGSERDPGASPARAGGARAPRSQRVPGSAPAPASPGPSPWPSPGWDPVNANPSRKSGVPRAHPVRRCACGGVRPALCHQHHRTPPAGYPGAGDTRTHTIICRAGPAEAPPRIHVRAMCSAHGRAGGVGTGIPDEWLIWQVLFIACSETREAAACAACQALVDGAGSTVWVPSSVSFFRCKFGKLLTKLFGLNHVRPNERYRRGGLRGHFVLQSAFPALQSSAKGFLLHLSHVACTQVQEMGAFPQPCHNSALFPLYSPATAGPRGDAGEGTHYQSSPGKSKQAARAAPLSINAFTPSKPFQRKQNPFRSPTGGQAHLGRPEPAAAARTPPGPGARPPRRAAARQVSAALLRHHDHCTGKLPSSRPRSLRSPLCPAPPGPPPLSLCPGRRSPPSPAAPAASPGGAAEKEVLGSWKPRSGQLGPRVRRQGGSGAVWEGGCCLTERWRRKGSAEPPSPRGRAVSPGPCAPPPAPACWDGARGRSIAPGRFIYSLISEEPSH